MTRRSDVPVVDSTARSAKLAPMSTLEPVAGDGPGCIRTLAIFALVASPVYLLLRVVVRSARQMYGFEEVPDEPPLVICQSCHNTVLEAGWTHCPYCGTALPVPEPGQYATAPTVSDVPTDAPTDVPTSVAADDAEGEALNGL